MSSERPEETEEKERSYSTLYRALQVLKLAMQNQLKSTPNGETSIEPLI
jgi:hypothetical protein